MLSAETCTVCEVDCGACPCETDCPDKCGDGTCGPTETFETCPKDCDWDGPCGNGVCEAAFDEDCWTCPQDCWDPETCEENVCGNGTCAPW